jgi:hypothetical protein
MRLKAEARLFSNFKALSKWRHDKSLTKKASLNALAEALDYGARLLVGFMINPLLLAGVGNFGYGAWQVLVRLIGHIAPASGRPTQALKWTLASQQDSTDDEEKRRHVGSAIAVWFLFLPLLLTLGGLLAWFVPSWLKAPVALVWSVRLAAVLLVADLIMSSLVEVPRSVLGGENLGYKRNDANLIDLTLDLRRKVLTGFLSTALALVVAGVLVRFYNAGITGLCLGFLAGRLILSLVYPWLVGRFLSFPLSSQLKEILRPAFVSILLFGMALHLEKFLKAKGWIDLILSIGLTVAVVAFTAFYGGISGAQRQQMRDRLHLLIDRQKIV